MTSRRPRLSSRVAVRRHLVDGRAQVVLHVLDSERTAVIGEREWDVLRGADGSRDVDGLVAAAEQRRRRISREQVEAFVQMLDGAGMLQDGPEPPPEPSEQAARPERPLLLLPDYALRCSGEGTCCRLYPTTLLSAREATRARALLPDVLDAGDDEARAFTPRRGAVLLPWQQRAASMVNGRCCYLDGAGLCQLHSMAGEAAKPAGCRLFPLTFVDDGIQVRVSVAPECSCVFDSALDDGALDDGAPGDSAADDDAPSRGMAPRSLLAPGVNSSSQLPAEVWIEPTAATIRITAEVSWEPQAYAQLRAGLLALASRQDVDLARRLWRVGEQLSVAPHDVERALTLVGGAARDTASAGDGERDSESVQDGSPIAADWAKALRQRLEARYRRDAGWRSEADLTRHAFRWLQQACAVGAVPSPEHDVRDERFYLRATAFGDLWLREDEPPLAFALQQRAVRLWLARAGRSVPAPAYASDPAWRQPLALVEALVRGYGLQAGAPERPATAVDP